MNFQSKLGQAAASHVATKSTSIQPVPHRVTRGQRERRNGHSGAGKSTLVVELENELLQVGYSGYDQGLCGSA
jgi:ABC-type methionine transport system ATPase subunit